MQRHDYTGEVIEDARGHMQDWIDQRAGRISGGYYADADDAYSEWLERAELEITGNMDGSYYFSAAEAAEACGGYIFDPDLAEWLQGMGFDGVPVEQGPEAVDVLIRIWTLDNEAWRLRDMVEARGGAHETGGPGRSRAAP